MRYRLRSTCTKVLICGGNAALPYEFVTEMSSAAEREEESIPSPPCRRAYPDWLVATLPARGRRLRLRSSLRCPRWLVRWIPWARSSWCCRSGGLPWRVWLRRRWQVAPLPRVVLRAPRREDTAARPYQWPRVCVGGTHRRWAGAGENASDPAARGSPGSCGSAWRRWLWGECSSSKD